ncbi:MAG: TatD family hydrolase [Lachnospiraceae bacterium]|nr:TatD family hydrolase [Lachnospiraceae bacterium]
MIFDTHAHYDDRAFDEDREEVIARIFDSGVGFVMNIGADLASSLSTVMLAQKYDRIYAAVGIHPESFEEADEHGITVLKDLIKSTDRVKAVGEIGIDLHYDRDSLEKQKEAFVRQWDLADEFGLPVIIHSRDAAQVTYDIVKERYERTGKPLNAVMHCYSYEKEQAVEYTKMGLYIGVGGVLTFKNGRKLAEAVKAVPMDKILIETDCPYLAPEPFRGKRNDSSYLKKVVAELAVIRGISEQEAEDITFANAEKFYAIEG